MSLLQGFGLAAAILSCLSFFIGVYQLRRAEPDRWASTAFMAGCVISAAGVILFMHAGGASGGPTRPTHGLYTPYATALDIEGGITALAFTQNGRILLIGTGEGKILFWNTIEKKIVTTISAHESPITSLQVSKDGALFLTSSRSMSIKIWHLPSGAPVTVWTVPQESTLSESAIVGFLPTGRMLALGRYDELDLYQVGAGEGPEFTPMKSLKSTEISWPSKVSYSPDGALVAIVGQHLQGRLAIPIWRASDGVLLQTLRSAADVHEIAFSSNGLVATAGDDKSIVLWDLAQGQSKYALAAHDGQILAVGFTPDGSCLASGGDDKKINLWDTASGGLIQTINEGVDNVVRTLAFSPDRGHLLAAGIYTTLFIWTRTD